MRAFAIDRLGEAGSLRELPIPGTGPEDILVRIHAAGVNPLDLKIRDGKKAAGVSRFPHVLGQDAAGVVERVGEAVTGFKPGDAVYGAFWLSGAFAEYASVTVSKAAIASKPTGLDFAQAAALPTPGLAALAAIRAVAIERGERLLVVGATGGVGSYVVQLAARQGARVIAPVRQEAREYVRRLGVTEVFDRQGDLVPSIKRAYPDGIDAVIDMVSGREALADVSTVLRSGGRLATTIHSADESAMRARGIHATNVDVFGATSGLDELNGVIEERDLVIPVERSFALEHASEALEAVASGHTRGKIILTIHGQKS